MTAFQKEIQTLANDEIKNSGTPSLQIAAVIDDEMIFEGAFGLSDVENDIKATPTKKYRTASVAKWFTATAAMRLSESGELDLDQNVQAYCPEFPVKDWQGKKVSITARQLLSQTSGIRNYVDFDELISKAVDQEAKADLEQRKLRENLSLYSRYTDVVSPLATFRDDPLEFEPGTKWQYTSFGYRLLACVLQGAAKTDYRTLMERLVFEPASMDNTVPDDAWTIVPNRVSGYRLQRGNPLRRADMRDVSENLPAGGYLSTATDLVKFAQAFDGGLVSNRARQLMSSPVLVDRLDEDSDPSWRDAIPTEERYGYGLMLFSKYHAGMIGHTGRQAGASAILILLPNHVAISVMTNAKGWNGYLTFALKLYDIVEKHFPRVAVKP